MAVATSTEEQTERKRGTRCCICVSETPGRLDGPAAEALAGDLGILAHPIRLQILDLLSMRAGEVCVCDLEAALPVKQPTISHHLKLLRQAGLVDVERHGLWAFYTVRRGELAALRERVEGALRVMSNE
jgi:ArsR family transcriptional regulator